MNTLRILRRPLKSGFKTHICLGILYGKWFLKLFICTLISLKIFINTWPNGYVIEKKCKKTPGLNYEYRVQNPSLTDLIWNSFCLLITAMNKVLPSVIFVSTLILLQLLHKLFNLQEHCHLCQINVYLTRKRICVWYPVYGDLRDVSPSETWWLLVVLSLLHLPKLPGLLGIA